MAKAWKATERRIAHELGGERVPVNGRQRGSAPDIAHGWLAIEVKSRAQIPAWLLTAMAQAEASAIGTDKLPLAIIHADHSPYDSSLAVFRLGDFREWFGSTTSQPVASPDIPAQEKTTNGRRARGRRASTATETSG